MKKGEFINYCIYMQFMLAILVAMQWWHAILFFGTAGYRAAYRLFMRASLRAVTPCSLAVLHFISHVDCAICHGMKWATVVS